MAKIYKKEAPEAPKPKGSKVFYALAILCALVGLVLPVAFGVAAVLAVIGIALAPGNRSLHNISRAGQAGENATADFIAQFPDSYSGFQNLKVTYEGKQSEIDMVVVGPTGVYIIETKNHNGHIRGSFESHDWMQYKVGRAGGQYSKEFYSPVKQVGTHVYRLAHYLRLRGAQVHVDAMVFFTNPAATVEVYGTPGNIPVYAGQTGAELIAKQIIGGKPVLSPQTVESVCRLLEQCL